MMLDKVIRAYILANGHAGTEGNDHSNRQKVALHGFPCQQTAELRELEMNIAWREGGNALSEPRRELGESKSG